MLWPLKKENWMRYTGNSIYLILKDEWMLMQLRQQFEPHHHLLFSISRYLLLVAWDYMQLESEGHLNNI